MMITGVIETFAICRLYRFLAVIFITKYKKFCENCNSYAK